MNKMPIYEAPNRRFMQPSRPYDFLYDNTYTLPSRADFLASVKYGSKAGAQHKIRPVYDTMFSAVKTDTRNVVCMTKLKPDVIDNFVHQYDVKGVPIIPADTGSLPLSRLIDEVTGADRYKYAPWSQQYGQPTYKLDINQKNFNADNQKSYAIHQQLQYNGSKRTVNKSVQTDYRESESQTDPYSPPYFLPYPGAYPKLLALVKLTWEKGLPFSLDDIVIIERALSKRVLEHEEHAVENEDDFKKRIKLMEELEAQQWADREKELEKLCQRKMELTNRLLQEYAARVANDHTVRLERLHEKLKAKNQENFQNIKHRYFRNLRKLERKYIHKKEPRQRNIVKDYTELDSRVYAPLIRNGIGTDELTEEPTGFSWDINDFDKIDAITSDASFIKTEFDVDHFRDKIEKCKPIGSTKRLEKKLEDIYVSFNDQGMQHKKAGSLGSFKAYDRSRKASTPEARIEEDMELAWRRPHIVLLQKIARGRAVQKPILEEMDRIMDDILELKRIYDLGPPEPPSEVEMAPPDYIDGEILAKMIDAMDEEMTRLMDERKVHALILLAERERKLREAMEGGRRFKEEEARRANDEVFKQITGIHQGTVDMYLEEVFLESCDRVADDHSRVYVQQLASTLNDAMRSVTHDVNLGDFEQEELAADLVSSFMIPELHRMCHNNRVDDAGARYKKASSHVLAAVLSAYPATKELSEGLESVVDEHLLRSHVAFDGAIEAIDDTITEAASAAAEWKSTASKPVAQTVSSISEVPSAAETSEEMETKAAPGDNNAELPSDINVPRGTMSETNNSVEKNRNLLTKSIKFLGETEISSFETTSQKEEDELDHRSGDDTIVSHLIEMEDQEDDPDMVPTEITEEILVEETDEEVERGEYASNVHTKLTITVADHVIRKMAAKSVQITYGTETSQQVYSVFAGAHEGIDEIFDEVHAYLSPRTDDSDSTFSRALETTETTIEQPPYKTTAVKERSDEHSEAEDQKAEDTIASTELQEVQQDVTEMMPDDGEETEEEMQLPDTTEKPVDEVPEAKEEPQLTTTELELLMNVVKKRKSETGMQPAPSSAEDTTENAVDEAKHGPSSPRGDDSGSDATLSDDPDD